MRAYWKVLPACCALFFFMITANAQTNSGVLACGANSESVYCLCRDGQEQPDASVFPAIAAAAVAVRNQFCSGLLPQEAVSSLVLDFVSDNWSWETQLGGFDGDVSASLINESRRKGGPIGLVDPLITDDGQVVLNVGDENVGGGRFAVSDVTKCAAATNDGGSEEVRCERAVRAFVDIYAYAQKTYAAFDEYKFAKNVGALRADWDNFFDASRGMTSLELLVNSRLHRKDETSQFSGPPDKQWVLLHPGIVIENVQAAADGEEFEEALALEVIGVNFWREDRWFVPSGGSLTLLYSDKASTDDLGIGLQFFFKSAYGIGFSNRGGDSGVFVSLDLLKLFRDRSSELGTFLE